MCDTSTLGDHLLVQVWQFLDNKENINTAGVPISGQQMETDTN